MSNEQYVPIIKDGRTGLEKISTLDELSRVGVKMAIKNDLITPEEAIRLKEKEWAQKQGRRFTLPTLESRSSQYQRSCEERAMFDRNKQPFIFEGFTPEGDFYLSQGLTLVGAMSGKGKSTAAANILAGFLSYKEDTTALVISNEESTDAILHRTACVLLKKSYMKFHNKGMWAQEENEITDLAKQLLTRVIVINDPAWNTASLEDVQTILEGSASQGVNLIIIDYLQTVNQSRDNPDMEGFQVLKKFGVFVREFGRRAPVPVIVFCQLNPKSSASEFQARVQNDKTIFNDAFNVVEIEPDLETKLTNFTIWKQRFGISQGVKVSMNFVQGRYEQVGAI